MKCSMKSPHGKELREASNQQLMRNEASGQPPARNCFQPTASGISLEARIFPVELEMIIKVRATQGQKTQLGDAKTPGPWKLRGNIPVLSQADVLESFVT